MLQWQVYTCKINVCVRKNLLHECAAKITVAFLNEKYLFTNTLNVNKIMSIYSKVFMSSKYKRNIIRITNVLLHT